MAQCALPYGRLRADRRRAMRIPMERVWEYPRPPVAVPCASRIRVELGGLTLADSSGALRVLETSHPPTIYIPPADVRGDVLEASRNTCHLVRIQGRRPIPRRRDRRRRYEAIGWSYADPSPQTTRRCWGTSRSIRVEWTPRGSETSGSSPRRATSMAAGSPPTSSDRSRARPARAPGSSPAVRDRPGLSGPSAASGVGHPCGWR